MQYFGGKARIAKQISPIINSYIGDREYHEPFLGGGSVMANIIAKKRFGYDLHFELIEMYKALINGWIPPDKISFEDYYYIKEFGESYLKAFVGFGCSYSGRYFEGYARNKRGTNYCLSAKNSVLKKMKSMMDVTFVCQNYEDLDVKDSVIYCDPPYKGVRQYSICRNFNHEKFWQWCRKMSESNIIFVSEYHAPPDFNILWSKNGRVEVRNKNNERAFKTEKLFTI